MRTVVVLLAAFLTTGVALGQDYSGTEDYPTAVSVTITPESAGIVSDIGGDMHNETDAPIVVRMEGQAGPTISTETIVLLVLLGMTAVTAIFGTLLHSVIVGMLKSLPDAVVNGVTAAYIDIENDLQRYVSTSPGTLDDELFERLKTYIRGIVLEAGGEISSRRNSDEG